MWRAIKTIVAVGLLSSHMPTTDTDILALVIALLLLWDDRK